MSLSGHSRLCKGDIAKKGSGAAGASVVEDFSFQIGLKITYKKDE